MEQNNSGLSKEVDKRIAEIAAEVDKIDAYNQKYHPDKKPSYVPGNIPVIDIDKEAKNQADIAKICNLIEKNSLKNHKATKNRKKENAKKVAIVAASGTVLLASIVTILPGIERKVNAKMKEQELNIAVEYMNEHIMPEVFFNSGFDVLGINEKGKPIYKFERINGIKATDYLVEHYGFTRDSAELLVAKSLDFDQKLYPEGVTPDEYYMSKNYKDGNGLESEMIGGVKPFTNLNEEDVINQVNKIKEEGQKDNARS